MKISYLILYAFGMGGTIRTVINQANAMACAGHEVEIVSVLGRRAKPRFPVHRDVRLRVLTRPAPTAAPGVEIPEEESSKAAFTTPVELAVIDHLRALTDGVLVTTRPGLNILAARYASSRVVRLAQEHMHLDRHRDGLRLAIQADYQRLDAVVTLTEADQKSYTTALGGLTRIERIPNAVHTLDGPVSDQRRKIVIAAGRLTRQKGFDLLIRAFAQVVEDHPDWQLRIFGGGRQEERLRRIIRRCGMYNHVFLMGRTNRLDEELAKASIYALSSRFEGFGMVIPEAMSHGVPVVAFDCPEGPREIISSGRDGLLVPPKDCDALAASICRLIDDDPLRRRMGGAALVKAAQYGPGTVTPRWERLFGELLADKHAHTTNPAGSRA